ncbi:hypothetical protein D3C75_1204640 [compost metagenome]
MASSAPSWRTGSRLPAPQVVATRAPAQRANWMANPPTALPPPWISTVIPARSAPSSKSPAQAARAGVGTAAAAGKSRLSGIRTVDARETQVYSA